MSTDLQVIVDDNSGAFSYSWSGGSTTSSPWVLSTLTQWYKASSWYPSSATQTGTFTFTFNGTAVGFFGNTPRASPQTATVQIDNGTSFGIDYNDPTPPTYKQWYITPTLPDGRHTVRISDLHSTAIDYAIVKVGNSTSLTNQTVIVDDDSHLIQYSGQWSRNTEKFIPGSLPTGYPYGNVTHRSSNPGDSFTFQFSGTSLSVYGIFSWFNLGSLSATYTIDGTAYPSTIPVTRSSPSYLNEDGEVSNYLYFGLDDLSSGTHTLVVNITQSTNQTFMLDYITYKPSFDTLSSMPSLPSNVGSGSSTSRKSSATSLLASSTGSIAAVSGGGSPKSASTGAIVGGVIGALVLGVLVTVLVILLILRRRRARELEWNYADNDATLASGTSANHPYMPDSQMQERPSHLRPQATTGSVSPFPLSGSQRHYGVDVKHAAYQKSNSRTEPHSSSSAVQSPTMGNSTSVQVGDPLTDPPSYDAISDRILRQP